MADTEIILNDCFKTKRAKVSNIAKCFKNAVSQTNNTNKATLTFSLNDLCILRRYEGNYYKDVAYYDNELYPDPTDTHYEDLTSDEYNSTVWQPHNGTIGPLSESAYAEQATKISNYPGTDFPELKNITGYHIACLPTRDKNTDPAWDTSYNNNNWNGYKAKHFLKSYSDGYITSMYSAEVIEASFTIAIPSVAVRRYTIFDPGSEWYRPEDTYVTDILDCETYPESLLQNNPVLSQRNFITIGANLADSTYNARFVLFFDNITKNPYNYIQENTNNTVPAVYNCEPGVYLVLGNEGFVPSTDNNFDNTRRYIIPGWDGNSLKTFKFYARKINGNIKGTLKIINDEDEEILITDDIDVTSVTADSQSSSQFGQYSRNHITNFIIKDLYYKIKPTDQYNFSLQSKDGYENFTTDDLEITGAKKLIDHFVDYYKYSIGTNSDTNSGDVYWFNGMHTQINDLRITLQNDLFDEKLHGPYFLFQKKDKEIKVITEKNLITAFENPGKNIYKINLSELESLDTLDLSNNELTSIDLSNNIHLQNINLSNNINLTEIIWPKGLLIENKTYNIDLRNTSIDIIEFTSVPTNPKDIKCKLDLKIDLTNNIIKLNLQGISLINPDTETCDVMNANFTNIKEVNISETNILSKKTRLEKFLDNLPDRSRKEPGIIYMYGKKYTSEGVQGSAKAIKDTLENLKNKNWLFYL